MEVIATDWSTLTRRSPADFTSDSVRLLSMANEPQLLIPGSRPPALAARLHLPSLAIGSAGVALSLLTGFYWIAGAFGIITTIQLVRYAMKKTAAHENKMSLPPALEELRLRLGSLNLDPGVHSLSERTLNQLARLQASARHAAEILQAKLDPTELAFDRFRTGLQDAAAAVFAELQKTTEHISQASLLGARTAAAEGQKQQAELSLQRTETALVAFANAISALSDIQTISENVDLSEAIKKLEQIAARAKNLSAPKDSLQGE